MELHSEILVLLGKIGTTKQELRQQICYALGELGRDANRTIRLATEQRLMKKLRQVRRQMVRQLRWLAILDQSVEVRKAAKAACRSVRRGEESPYVEEEFFVPELPTVRFATSVN